MSSLWRAPKRKKTKKLPKRSINQTLNQWRREIKKFKKQREKEERIRLIKIHDLHQKFSSSSAQDHSIQESIEEEYCEPIILEERARGVRKVIPQQHCDECLMTPGAGKSLTIYSKTNRGKVAICDYCINEVQARSGRGGDAFRGSFLGGSFNPR